MSILLELKLRFASSGLYSKVSTVEMAPSINRKMIRFALTGSGGVFGASGFTALASAAETCFAIEPSSPASASCPNPAPAACNSPLRDVMIGL
jgi:hypothetical protein